MLGIEIVTVLDKGEQEIFIFLLFSDKLTFVHLAEFISIGYAVGSGNSKGSGAIIVMNPLVYGIS